MSLVQAVHHGAVLELRLNDPARRNTLTRAMCDALSSAVREAGEDPRVHALVITGASPAFCAGADLEDLKAAANGEVANVEAVYQSFMDVADCPLPTIAAVNGPAVGAGMNLALACDLRVASAQASFDTRFLQIGLHPGGGHSWMLLRAVSWPAATRMLLLGTVADAQMAKACGLVDDVFEPDDLVPAAINLARGGEALPRDLLIATKASLRLAARSTHYETFQHETSQQLRSLKEPPFQQLIARLQARLAER
ncbi:enoyl-CoA hydratase [Novosphingobium sp.]|uniref:enoyl-CoA hydratase n=1 Tax=Novosphingobium sp. TaxID=1874826 RepID=UPI002FD92E25